VIAVCAQGLGVLPGTPSSMRGLASSWELHLSEAEAMAHGWLRGPLHAQQPAGVMQAELMPSGMRVGVLHAAAPQVSMNVADALSLGARPVCLCSGTSTALSGPVQRRAESGLEAQASGRSPDPEAAAQPIQATRSVKADSLHDREPAALRPRTAQDETAATRDPALALHAEAHQDGVHVWLGVPTRSCRAASHVLAVLLSSPNVAAAGLARLVVNGRTLYAGSTALTVRQEVSRWN
jgi:hypothetical protein